MRDFHTINQTHINRAKNFGCLVDGTVTPTTIQKVYNVPHCHYCGKVVARKKRTADHIVPLSRFGMHSLSNLVMACPNCNSEKSSLTGEEHMLLRQKRLEGEKLINRVDRQRAKLNKILQMKSRLIKKLKV